MNVDNLDYYWLSIHESSRVKMPVFYVNLDFLCLRKWRVVYVFIYFTRILSSLSITLSTTKLFLCLFMGPWKENRYVLLLH